MICFLFSLTACGPNSKTARIEGKFSKLKSSLFCFISNDPSWQGIDSVTVDDGSFRFERPLSKPTIVTLVFPNNSKVSFIAVPGKTIKIKGSATALGVVDISGTKDNELVSDFRIKNAGKSPSELAPAAIDFIQTHAGSLAAEIVFVKYFIDVKSINIEGAKRLLGILQKAQPDNNQLKAIGSQLTSIEGGSVGQNLPSFNYKDINGNTVNNAQFAGRPLLIVFWASWNNPPPTITQQMRKLANTYGGKLAQLSISLDADLSSCKNVVQRDSVPGPVICDQNAWQSPLVGRFGIRYIPGNLLVDKKGKIIARDLKNDELNSQIESLMN